MGRTLSDTWSEADLETLVEKRDVERKKWAVIAAEMGRPLGTCFHRYNEIAKAREPAPSIIAEIPRIPPLHEELGIKTFTHMQAVLHTPYGGGRSGGRKGEQVHAHWYRMPITLAKVFA